MLIACSVIMLDFVGIGLVDYSVILPRKKV
jgi:hypothetical protein